jgi:hypothetical protein
MLVLLSIPDKAFLLTGKPVPSDVTLVTVAAAYSEMMKKQ